MARSTKADTADLLGTMAELARLNPLSYRQLLGTMRALFLQSNPTPGRGASSRKLHEHVTSKVRKIDFRRADELRAQHGAVDRPVVTGALVELEANSLRHGRGLRRAGRCVSARGEA